MIDGIALGGRLTGAWRARGVIPVVFTALDNARREFGGREARQIWDTTT